MSQSSPCNCTWNQCPDLSITNPVILISGKRTTSTKIKHSLVLAYSGLHMMESTQMANTGTCPRVTFIADLPSWTQDQKHSCPGSSNLCPGTRLLFPDLAASEQGTLLNMCLKEELLRALNHHALHHALTWNWQNSRVQTLFSGGFSCLDSREAAQRFSVFKPKAWVIQK